jgi:hypothetical protein
VTRAAVDEVHRCSERFSPELRRCCTVNKHSSKTIAKRTEYSLAFPILLQSIGAGQSQLNAMR